MKKRLLIVSWTLSLIVTCYALIPEDSPIETKNSPAKKETKKAPKEESISDKLKEEVAEPAYQNLAGKPSLTLYGNIPLFHLYGTKEEMAAQYGAMTKVPLQTAFSLGRLFLGERLLKQCTPKVKQLEAPLPETTKRELKALAKAAKVKYLEVVAVNVLPQMMCSTVSCWQQQSTDGKLIMGRNLDFELGPLAESSGVIIVYHPKQGVPLVSTTFLGLTASYAGINGKGVCYGNMLVHNSKEGANNNGVCPQILMRDAGLVATDCESYANYLRAFTHAAPQNIMVADTKKAIVCEIVDKTVHVREGSKGWIAATNSFREPKLFSRHYSCWRYNRFKKNFRKGKSDVVKLKASLKDTMQKDGNIQAVIFEPEKMRMHVALNSRNAASSEYLEFDVKKLIAGDKNPVILKKGQTLTTPSAMKLLYLQQ